MKFLILSISFCITGSLAAQTNDLPGYLGFVDTPDSVEIRDLKTTWALFESGSDAKAIQMLRKRILKDAEDVNSWLMMGFIYDQQQNYKKAIDCYNAAVAKDLTNPHAHFMRGNSYLKLKKYDSALRNYMAAIDQDPLFYEAYNNMALIRMMNQGQAGIIENDYFLAKKDIFKVLDKMKEGDERLFFNLGLINASVHEFAEAIAFFDKAIEDCEHDCAKSYFYRGICKFYLQDYQPAYDDIVNSGERLHKDERMEEFISLLKAILAYQAGE